MFDVGTVLLEVFLFDFAGDLYGQSIDVASSIGSGKSSPSDTIEELNPAGRDSRLAEIALTLAREVRFRAEAAPVMRRISSSMVSKASSCLIQSMNATSIDCP